MVKTWHPKPTKRFISDSQTGQYLTESGGWSDDEKEAKDFPSVFQALEFCCHNQIWDADLVFKFADGITLARLPISDFSGTEVIAFQSKRDQEVSLAMAS